MLHTKFEKDILRSGGTAPFLTKKRVPVPLIRFQAGRLRPASCWRRRPHAFALLDPSGLQKRDAMKPARPVTIALQ